MFKIRSEKQQKPPEVVVFDNPKRKRQVNSVEQPKVDVEESTSSSISDKQPTFNIKKARFDVQKFVISGLKNDEKEDAKVALAISLGAKPPKNPNINYKELLAKRRKEKSDNPTPDQDKLKIEKKKKRWFRQKNDVAGFDAQIGKFRNGVQVIKKAELNRIRKKKHA